MGKALDVIAAEPWLITPQGLEQIMAIAQRQGEDLEALAARLGRPLDNAHAAEIRGDTAVIPVRGPIMRYSNLFTQVSGATSLELLAKDFAAALDNPQVARIVLDIDSPGGQANGISEFAGMVRNAAKPVTAYVGGVGASAAYWVAAAAHWIVASDTAALGSIGVVGTFRPDNSGAIKVISSQSPLKQADPTTEAGMAEMQRVIDDLAAVFVTRVASLRGVPESKVLTDFGRGGLLIGEKAVAAGMADAVGTLEGVIAGNSNTPMRTGDSDLRAEIDRARQRQIEHTPSRSGKVPPPALTTLENPQMIDMDTLEAEILAAGLDAEAVEQRVGEEWQHNQPMREEFGDKQTATSYFQAVAHGRLRRLGKPGGMSRGRV